MAIPLLPTLAALLLAQAAPTSGQTEPDEVPRGLRLTSPEAFPGYTLFAPLASHHTHLIDMEGREVHRWTSEYGPSSVYLLEDGSILRSGQIEDNPTFNGGGICGRIERISWDGELLWSYELADEYQTQHHDARPMPNGNVLLITWEFRYREDCLNAGRDPEHIGDGGLWPDAVLEIEPTSPEGGEIVWEWHSWDHLVQDFDPDADNYGSVADHPGRIDINYDHRDVAPMSEEDRQAREELEAQMRALGYSGGDDEEEEDAADTGGGLVLGGGGGHGSDWLHTNAIDYNPQLDLIALSSPNMNEVWILDHSTDSEEAASHKGGRYGKGGDILWRWGNPKNYGAGTADDQRLFYQHNVQWIPPGLPGAGNLLVFNNGQQRPSGEHSTIEELVLPFVPGEGFRLDGAAFGPREPVWAYKDEPNFFAAFISGCQRLPNGNTLICSGPQGRLFEVTREGAIVWEYWNRHGGDKKVDGVDGKALFRATRVAADHPALGGRTLVPLEEVPTGQ